MFHRLVHSLHQGLTVLELGHVQKQMEYRCSQNLSPIQAFFVLFVEIHVDLCDNFGLNMAM